MQSLKWYTQEMMAVLPVGAGHDNYQLKTPYRDGTKDSIFEPLDFIARLAALVPEARVNLTYSIPCRVVR